MAETTMTKIMLDCMMNNNGLPEYLRQAVKSQGGCHGEAIEATQEYVHEIVSASLEGLVLPGFAIEIIRHAIDDCIDWRFLSERLLAEPELN